MTDIKYNDTEYLVDKFLDDIIRLSLVYVKNMEDAQDIAQQVFLTYLQKKPEFESIEHAKNWLFKVAVNTSRNHRRTQRQTVDFDSLENVLSTEDVHEMTEAEEAVFKAVMSLRENYREIIHMYYYLGYSTDEISEITGLSTSAVRTKLHRARVALEKTLKGGGLYVGKL